MDDTERGNRAYFMRLQGYSWDRIALELMYHSPAEAMHAAQKASLVDRED